MTEQEDILLQVKSIDPQAQIILYGSKSRGTAKHDSDWDFLILTNLKVNYQSEQKFSYPIYELEWETGNVFSVMVKSKQEWDSSKYKISPLYQNILKDGVNL